MTTVYETSEHYLNSRSGEYAVHAQLNGVRTYELSERSDDIHIKSVSANSLLLALNQADAYQIRFSGLVSSKTRVAGDVMLVPAGTGLRSTWQVNGYCMRSFALEFTDELFRNYVPELYSSRFAEGQVLPATPRQRPELASILMLIRRELQGSGARGKLFLDSALRLLAIEMAGSGWSVPTAMPAHGPQSDKRIARALDFIEENFSKDISLHDIATAAGCSLSLLTCKFEGETGKTPYSYVIDRRITYAESLLKTDPMSIAQVALEAGFGDQQHLTRVMRARRGQTPRMVRLGLGR